MQISFNKKKCIFSILCFMVVSMVFLVQPSGASPNKKTIPDWAVSNSLGDISIGRDDAPVLIVEYASLTCVHCANFHNEVLPILERRYVDKGLVKFIFRPFPIDPHATAGAMLVECASPSAQVGLLKGLFKFQYQWVRAKKPIDKLKEFAKQAGISEEDFVTCLRSTEILNNVRKVQDEAYKSFDITSVPSFIIEGKKFESSHTVEAFSKVIEEQLMLKKDNKPEKGNKPEWKEIW